MRSESVKISVKSHWMQLSQLASNTLLCLAAPGLRTPLAMPCSYPSPFGMVAHPGINGELGGAGAAYTGLHNISPQMSAVAAAAVAAYGRTQVVLRYTHPYLFLLGLFWMWFSCLDLRQKNAKHGGMCCIWLSRILLVSQPIGDLHSFVIYVSFQRKENWVSLSSKTR